MNFSKEIAKHFRDVFFGGNWTSVNLKDTLADVNHQQAIAKVQNLNTIAMLVFHINYYISAVLKVLQGEALKASDKYSFDLPAINSEEEWQKLLGKTFAEAEQFAGEIEKLSDDKLSETFQDAKYGNYFRNLAGIVEHTHYHLGQIVLIKKMMKNDGGPK